MKQQLYVEVWNILATTPGKPSLPVIRLLFVRCFQTKTQFIFKPYNTILCTYTKRTKTNTHAQVGSFLHNVLKKEKREISANKTIDE